MLINHGEHAIVCGKVTKDAEIKTIQKRDGSGSFNSLSFSVLHGKVNGVNAYIDIQIMFERAQFFKGIKKGDIVCAMGSIRKREYQGKIYETLDAEYLNVEKHDGTETAKQADLLSDIVGADIPF